jgi:hypothetical protein
MPRPHTFPGYNRKDLSLTRGKNVIGWNIPGSHITDVQILHYLANATDAELLALPNMGRKALAALREWQHGMTTGTNLGG